MNKDDLPITNLEPVDVEDIKHKLLFSDSWDSITEIRNYCDEILEQNDDNSIQPKTNNQIINNLIEVLNDLKN